MNWEKIKLFNWIYSKSSTYCAVYALNITSSVSIAANASFLSSGVYLFKSTCDGCKSSAEIECVILMSVKWSFLPSGCSVFLLHIPALFILFLFLPQALFLPYLWTASSLNTHPFPYSTRMPPASSIFPLPLFYLFSSSLLLRHS